MDFIKLTQLQFACNMLSDSIIARNTLVGFVGKEILDQEEEHLMKKIEDVKDKISEIEKGFEK